MSRLIDADALIKAWRKKHKIKEGDCGAVFVGYSEIPRLIDEQPTVDAVEVVRCKDCIYFDKYIDCKKMYQWDGFCADWARNTYENWYCSRAERRNDED